MHSIADVLTDHIRAIEPRALSAYYSIKFTKKRRKRNKKYDGFIDTSICEGFYYEGQMQIIVTWNFKYDIYFFQDERIVRTVKAAKYPELVELLNWVEKGN